MVNRFLTGEVESENRFLVDKMGILLGKGEEVGPSFEWK
jgi:hypothetical protein